MKADELLQRALFDGILVALRMMWPYLALGGLVPALKIAAAMHRRRRYLRAGMADIDGMTGREFEHYLKTVFVRLGYAVSVTPSGGDFGGDLIARKDRESVVIQAKRWKKNVGVKAVQETVAAKGYYRCDRAMVVTNSCFTEQARALAKANGVDLWDREKLSHVLLSLQAERTAPEG